jgi:hypothetical protein
MEKAKNGDPVNMFWTGGWDSTFRLLQAILLEKREVQPYYIIDHLRQSAGLEVYTMEVIRESILKNYPGLESYLHPTFYHNQEHIEPDEIVTDAWNRLNTHFHVGSQYEWLQRFSRQFDLNSIDVALFKDPNGSKSPLFRQWYNAFINHQPLPDSPYQKEITEDLSTLFEGFNFPVMSLKKTEMLEIAREKNWMPFMKHTRFCHRPKVHISPCGICKPCRQVSVDGMEWRIPLTGKLNRMLYSIKVKIKHDLLKL